jgi:hypothetical protein
MTRLIKRRDRLLAELGLLDEPLDLLAVTEELPRSWNGPHVALRMVEGFKTLAQMPSRDRKGVRTAWPRYVYEFEDLIAQAEQGELERTHERQNRVRIVPSASEIARAIEVCYWPMTFLSAKHPQLCEAVNMIALAHALGLDAGWTAKKRGGYADTWRTRHEAGCEMIAAGLERDRAAVF